jgi:hypothetical protein
LILNERLTPVSIAAMVTILASRDRADVAARAVAVVKIPDRDVRARAA